MNSRVDPCTDFAEYVCGNYKPEKVTRSSINLLVDSNQRTFRSILEERNSSRLVSSEDASGRRNLQKLQDFYSSCMNETQIASVGRQPLLDEIRTIVNLFPVKGSPFESLQNTTEFEASGRPLMNSTSAVSPQALSEALGHLYKLGLNAFASLRTERQSNGSGITFIFYPARIGIVSEMLYSEPVVLPRFTHGNLTKTLHLLTREENWSSFLDGEPIFSSNDVPGALDTRAMNINLFESNLNTFTNFNHLGSVSLESLSNLSDSVNWTLAFQKALPDDVDLPTSVTLFGIFFELFDGILVHFAHGGSLPLKIQGYLVWSLIKQMIRLIDPKYGYFFQPHNGPRQERWRYCVDVVNWTMGRMVAPFFVKQVSSEHETVHNMVDSIRSQLKVAYERAAGIDNSTKLRGMRTLNESRPFVGIDGASYAAESSAEIEDFYRNLTIDRNDYFGNRKNFAMWYRANSYRGVKGFVHRDHLDLLPQSNDIRQDTDGSNLQIPAGVLRPPLFHDEYPEYVNFGSLGAMIAERYMNLLDLGERHFRHQLNFHRCDSSLICQQRYCYYDKSKNLDESGDIYYFSSDLIAGSVGLQQSFNAWKNRSLSDSHGA
ncbi:hypothetical protein EC968_008916 [Mortierella alpina]|nr:hypothetical protein EC968_008916 [Mortierella alpina]